jgi:hypothetical protein
MTLLVAWLVLPVVLGLVATGAGLLVRELSDRELPGALLAPVGMATLVVVGAFLALADATAELITPAAVLLAVAGLALAAPRRRRLVGLNGWLIGALLATLALYAAPVVLSGQATFAGYIRLDDSATWMALTDRVMEHGRSLDGLAPSSYEATLAFNLASGYPVGGFLVLGIGHELVGTDVAWLIQPYMAFVALLLTLALWELAGSAVRAPWLRAAAAALGAQAALLVGYYLWGGVKEMAAAALVAAAAALAGHCVRRRFAVRSVVPLAIVAAAFLDVLSGGALLWLAPILAVALGFALGLLGRRAALRRSLAFLLLTAGLAVPALVAGLVPPTSASLTSETAQGNLLQPLSAWRVFGVWPAGDFRLDPVDPALAAALIAVVAVGAVFGLVHAWRSRAWSMPIYVACTALAGLAIFAIGSPWVGGKALATASPALPFAAAVGGAALWSGGRRLAGGALLSALAVGILWSDALAYRDVNLAPRDQLAELERVGDLIAGEGPTLMTEYQPYGVRHFLRDADPEGASELRRRPVALKGGGTLAKGTTADSDRFRLDALTVYRTLVLRRSPAQSRPPSPFRLVWRGQYYEVWQRGPGGVDPGLVHLGLGSEFDPGGSPRCARVRRLAGRAGPRGRLAAVAREPVIVVPLTSTSHPAAWKVPGLGRALLPGTPGALEARVRVAEPGAFEIWLRGSVRPQVDLVVDGRPAGSVRHQLENVGEYVRLGDVRLDAGRHTLGLTFHGADLHPGSGGQSAPIGPLALASQDAADTRMSYVDPSGWRRLCRGRWDWIEALPAGR